MNHFLLIRLATIVLLANSLVVVGDTGALESLNQLRWKNRILLVRDEPNCDKNHAAKLTTQEVEIDDRDLIWFIFCDHNITTNYTGLLSDNFASDINNTRFNQDNQSVILIGKDGGTKQSTNKLDLNSLFQLIDSMPMRQIEMRQAERYQ